MSVYASTKILLETTSLSDPLEIADRILADTDSDDYEALLRVYSVGGHSPRQLPCGVPHLFCCG